MTPQFEAHDLPVPAQATPDIAEHALHIGKRNAAGLFDAACSRDYAEEICGCPICERAAHDRE